MTAPRSIPDEKKEEVSSTDSSKELYAELGGLLRTERENPDILFSDEVIEQRYSQAKAIGNLLNKLKSSSNPKDQENYAFFIKKISWFAACLTFAFTPKNKNVQQYIQQLFMGADCTQIENYKKYLDQLIVKLKTKAAELQEKLSPEALATWFCGEFMLSNNPPKPEIFEDWIDAQDPVAYINSLFNSYPWKLKKKEEEQSSSDILFSGQDFASEAEAKREIDRMKAILEEKYGDLSDGVLFRISFHGNRSQPPFQVGIYLDYYATISKQTGKSSEDLRSVLEEDIKPSFELDWHKDSTRNVVLSQPLENPEAVVAHIKSHARTDRFCSIETQIQSDGRQIRVVAIDLASSASSLFDPDRHFIAVMNNLSFIQIAPPSQLAKTLGLVKTEKQLESMSDLFYWLTEKMEKLRQRINTQLAKKTPKLFSEAPDRFDRDLMVKIDQVLNLSIINIEAIRLLTTSLIERVLPFSHDTSDWRDALTHKNHHTIIFIKKMLKELVNFTQHNPHPAYQMVFNLLKPKSPMMSQKAAPLIGTHNFRK